MSEYPTISLADWPPKHRIVAFHSGAAETAERLREIGGFDPVLMRASAADQSGAYLLLPDQQAARWDQAQIEAARQAATVELIATACTESTETAAYLVAVNGVVRGRWSAGDGGHGAMVWRHGERVATGDCGGDTDAIAGAVRSTIPASDIAALRLSIPASRIAVKG